MEETMNPQKKHSTHEVIFSSLVALVLCAVGASLLHLPPVVNNAIVLVIAFAMAGLVVAQYMGLKIEGPVVRLVVTVPVLLFIILVFLMMPDVAHVPAPSFLRFY